MTYADSRVETGRVPRMHVDAALEPGTEVSLDKAASHHLVDVLRARPGSAVDLFRGDGVEHRAVLLEGGRRALLRIESSASHERESPLRIALLQGLSRGERMDATVRQSVELGVAAIRPVATRRSGVRLDAARAAKKHAHWSSIVVSACEQCGRSRLPRVHGVADLGPALRDALVTHERAPGPTSGLVLVPGSPESLAGLAWLDELVAGGGGSLALLIGPESGLDDDEVELAVAAGFRPVSLGPRVLRTETAGPAALAILQARYGDLA